MAKCNIRQFVCRVLVQKCKGRRLSAIGITFVFAYYINLWIVKYTYKGKLMYLEHR